MVRPSLVNPDYRTFAPRIGFAYRINQCLGPARRSTESYYGGQERRAILISSPGFNPPYFLSQSFSSPCGSPVRPTRTQRTKITVCYRLETWGQQPDDRERLDPGVPRKFADGFPTTTLLYSIDRNIRTPMMHQWHFGLEYQLPAQTVLGVLLRWIARHSSLWLLQTETRPSPARIPNEPLAPRRPFPALDGTIDAFSGETPIPITTRCR